MLKFVKNVPIWGSGGLRTWEQFPSYTLWLITMAFLSPRCFESRVPVLIVPRECLIMFYYLFCFQVICILLTTFLVLNSSLIIICQPGSVPTSLKIPIPDLSPRNTFSWLLILKRSGIRFYFLVLIFQF